MHEKAEIQRYFKWPKFLHLANGKVLLNLGSRIWYKEHEL